MKLRRSLAAVRSPADSANEQLPFVVNNRDDLTGDKSEEQDTGQRDNGCLGFGKNAEQAVDIGGVGGRVRTE